MCRSLYFSLFFFSGIFLLILSSCSHQPEHKKVIVKKKQDVNKITAEELEEIMGERSDNSMMVINGDTLQAFPFFMQLYDQRYEPFFVNKGKYNALGDSLLSLIRNARWYGLVPEDYHLAQLDTLTAEFYNTKDSTYDAYAIAQSELLLCDAWFKMGAHVNKGRFYPDSLRLEWKPAKLDSNWRALMTEGLQTKNLRAALDSLEPRHEAYVFLKNEFRKFLKENEQVNWDSVSFFNITDTLLFKEDLKNRLLQTGDYDSTATGNDSVKLAKAIKSFQLKFNLEPDGKLGKYTKQALSYSKEKVIRQMEMAMERWRWESRDFPETYFWVNIPSAQLTVYEADTVVLQSNVVVGKPETPTPALKSKINYMLIYPYWNVPVSIATKEILPAVQRDTSYLRRKNFEVIGARGKVIDPKTIKWKKYTKDHLPFKFRQRIGDDNSLGVVKFNFNNKYGVYLHDTNSKKYFKTFYRFQSHGCMRLEKYMEVARFLIRDDTLKLPYDTLDRYFATPEQRKIPIKKNFPIYVKYYTCTADTAGLHVYIDIYKRDEQLMKVVYGRKEKR